jgi:hypothetical protein
MTLKKQKPPGKFRFPSGAEYRYLLKSSFHAFLQKVYPVRSAGGGYGEAGL